MLLMPDPEHRGDRPVHAAQDAEHHLLRATTRSRGESYSRDPRYIAKKAEEYLRGTGIADTATSGPRRSSSSSTTCASTRTSTRATTTSTRSRASWNSGRDESTEPEPRLQDPVQGGLLPGPADGPVPGPALRDDAHARAGRHRGRGAAPRGRHRRPGRDRHALRHAARRWPTSSCSTSTSSRTSRVSTARRVTFMPKPLFQDNGSGMHVHQSLWKDGEPLFFDEKGYAGLSRHGALVHRRPAQARAGAARVHEPRRPTRTSGWCPGYEAPVNLVYSQRNRSAVGAHPAVLEEPEGEAPRVPLPRPVVQPVPRVLGDAAWPASTASRTASSRPTPRRQGPLRPPARGAGEGAAGAGLARRGARRARGRPRVPARGRRVHARRDRHLDRRTSARTRSTPIRLRPHPWEFYLYYDI